MASSFQPRRKLSIRRKGKEPSMPQTIERGANLDGWISDEDVQLVFVRDFKERKIIPHKRLRINTFQNEGFTFQEHLKFQGLKHFVEMGGGSSLEKRYYPDLVKTFYCNVFRNGLGIIQSKVKGVHIYLNDDIWHNVAKLPLGGGTNITLGFEGFNKLEVYRSFLKENHNENINLFKTGPMRMNERLLAYIISWVLCPRGSNHAQMTTEDVLILYGLVNGIRLDWPQIIGDNMIKARRYNNYPLPYGVFISKVLVYLGVDVSGEKELFVGPQNLIHSNVLHHMGFMQRGDR